MADNTVINPGAGGDVIADDDITDVASVANGAKVQRIKNGFGADGTYADVTAATPLPVAQQGTATVDTELPAAAVLADATANPTVPGIAEYSFAFNGTTWDRRRTATAANGTSGTGVPAAGMMGFDGTSYRRVLTDTSGNLQASLAGPGVADLMTNPSSAASVSAFGLVWNGSTWDRVSNPTQVTGSSTGHGIVAAGIMGQNASGQYLPLPIDSNGAHALMTAPQFLDPGAQGFNAVSQSSSSLDARGFSRFSVQLTGTWVGTFRIQGSNDGSTWVDYYPASATGPSYAPNNLITANGIYTTMLACKYVRLTTTTWSSGTASAYMQLLSSPSVPYTTVTPTPASTGGWTSYVNAALSSTAATPKSSAGVVGGYMAYNPNTSVTYLQGLSSGTYLWCIGIPPGSAANIELTHGIQHAANIQVLASNTAGSAVAPTTAIPITLLYK